MASEAGAKERAALPSLESIHPRHVVYVRSLIARLGVAPAHEREDLAQEVLFQAHRSKGSRLPPMALLSGITRHVVFRWLAKRERERRALNESANESPEEASVPSPEDDWLARERWKAVHAAIAELPPMFREVFVRCAIDEMPIPEVARCLGIPVNTAHSRLHLARARIAEVFYRLLARRRLRDGDL